MPSPDSNLGGSTKRMFFFVFLRFFLVVRCFLMAFPWIVRRKLYYVQDALQIALNPHRILLLSIFSVSAPEFVDRFSKHSLGFSTSRIKKPFAYPRHVATQECGAKECRKSRGFAKGR